MGVGDGAWTVVVEPADGAFAETLNSPLRQKATRIFPAVHLTTTANSIYLVLPILLNHETPMRIFCTTNSWAAREPCRDPHLLRENAILTPAGNGAI
jgi:hypothetical protein